MMSSTPSSHLSSESDKDLCRRYVESGDQRAFQLVVHRYAGMVWQTAKRRCGGDEEASEVAQDVFIVLARKAGSLRPESGIGPWLHRIAVILSAKFTSRRARQLRHRENMLNSLSTNPGTEPAPVNVSPLLLQLDESLDRLPTGDRAMLMWRYFDRLSLQDIAIRLGKSEAACQKQSERALARLRRLLQRHGLAVAGLMAVLSTTGTAGANGHNASEWAKTALQANHLPGIWNNFTLLKHAWHRLPVIKWLAPAAAAAGLTVALWPHYTGQSVSPARGVSAPAAVITKATSPLSQSQPAPGPAAIATDGRPPIEPALTAEVNRRRSARRELHLTMISERLGLDNAQRAEAGRLYDQHRLGRNSMLGRQGKCTFEVSANYDSYAMGSLGPLTIASAAFDNDFAALLRPEQLSAWTQFQTELNQNAVEARVNAYLGNWLFISNGVAVDLAAAREAFLHLATDDIQRRQGFWIRETDGPFTGSAVFHAPPYFEYHQEAIAGILAGATIDRFRKMSALQDYASLAATFRANMVSAASLDIYGDWRRSLPMESLPPESRALSELSRIQTSLLLTPVQIQQISTALVQRATTEPPESWPGLALASDAEFFARRQRDNELLSPILTPLQLQVHRDGPLSSPGIGVSFSYSARYDARAE